MIAYTATLLTLVRLFVSMTAVASSTTSLNMEEPQ